MPQFSWSKIDSQLKWWFRDTRPPWAWTTQDRARRTDVVVISSRWKNASSGLGSSNNPYGPGKAIPGAINLVNPGGSFFVTWNTAHTGTYGGAFGNDPNYKPVFASQDSAHWNGDRATFPVGDDVRDWGDLIVNNGLHAFNVGGSDLSSTGQQGWYEPALRIDESSVQDFGAGKKCFQPLWAINFALAGAPAAISAYVLSTYSWADGLNWEYWEPADWYKNWNQCAYWLGLTTNQKNAYSAAYRAGQESTLALIRAGRPDWIITGQQSPYQGSSHQNKPNGLFREDNPTRWGTNSANLTNSQSARSAMFADSSKRRQVTLWQAPWTPNNSDGTTHFTDAQIEAWKPFIRDAHDYFNAGDGAANLTLLGAPNSRNDAWESPDVSQVREYVLRPNAPGSLAPDATVGPGGPLPYQAAGDSNDNTWNELLLAGNGIDSHHVANLSAQVDFVKRVDVWLRVARTGTTGTVLAGPVANLGTPHQVAVEQTVPVAGNNWLVFTDVNCPDGGAWDPSKVNACEFGTIFASGTGGGTTATLRELDVEVHVFGTVSQRSKPTRGKMVGSSPTAPMGLTNVGGI